ncbi:hypothetical protein OPIT5_10390 [Opitutaceae bacterium TAV5]|nr:hypothetical protein OPIT5_10390 [Opitutaceae bacterium TAV5]
MNIKQNSTCLLLASLLCIPLHAEPLPGLSASPDGVNIRTTDAGEFTLPAPVLMLRPDDYDGQKPAVTVEDAATLLAKYPSGAELRIGIAQNAVNYTWSGLPDGAFAFRFVTLLPISLADGGTFMLGNNNPAPFPATKEKQTVAKGWARSFRLQNAAGAGFALATPGAFQEVQDNRVFNWEVFAYILNYRFDENSGATGFALTVTAVSADK